MAKRIDVSGLHAYYGGVHAIEDISMTIEPRSVTAFIGPSGCGKSTFLRTLNRMHEVIPGARVEARSCWTTRTCTTRPSTPSRCAASSAWSSSAPTRSPPCRSTTTSPATKLNGVRRKSRLDEIVEKSLRGANLWNEVKDRLSKPGASPVASSSASASPAPSPSSPRSS